MTNFLFVLITFLPITDECPPRIYITKCIQMYLLNYVPSNTRSPLSVKHFRGYSSCDYFGKENRFEFGHTLVEILQVYTMHNLPHRAQHFKMDTRGNCVTPQN